MTERKPQITTPVVPVQMSSTSFPTRVPRPLGLKRWSFLIVKVKRVEGFLESKRRNNY